MTDIALAQSAAGPVQDRLKQHLSDTARRELDALHAALDSRLLALEAALAHPGQHESLEALVLDLARVATVEAEASAARTSFEAERASQGRTAAAREVERLLAQERETTAALSAELEEVRRKLSADLAREQATGRKTGEKLAAAERALADALRIAQTRTTALDTAKAAATTAREAAAEKAAAAESAKAQAERTAQQAEARLREMDQRRQEADARAADADAKRRDAEARAEQAQARTREMEARTTAAETERQAAEARAADAAAKHQSAEARVAEAAARANDTLRAVDKLNADLGAAKQVAERHGEAADARHAELIAQLKDYEQRLASSVEQVRRLEVQLFRRDRPLQDRNENLSAMLARDLASRSRRGASRYTFAMDIAIDFGDEAGALLDLSISGAQVILSRQLEQGCTGKFSLTSDEVPVSGMGRVVWSQLDPDLEGQALRYRTGILFTAVEAAAVEAFIIRYSTP
jgi:chromosome segregation ATPase